MFGHKKGLASKLMEAGGTVAWATVLEGKERWQSATGSGFEWNNSKITDHMKLKLRVEPEGETSFEAELGQAFSGQVPFTGWQCKVVYDPADRSKIAVLEDSIAPPGITHHQAERAATHRAGMLEAAQSGHIAEYVEEMKSKAMSGELSGATFVGGQMVSGSAPAPAPAQPSVVDQLTKLADLRDRGVLTDAEFEAQKAKLLASG
jgi:Short C-terminal domain